MKINSVENFIAGSHTLVPITGTKASEVEIITTRKEKPKFDITKEINNRTFIRPLPPKGHIVKTSILNAPLSYVADLKTDMNALKSAWKGNANDHQLGKLNDLGMKLGGLAIAGYLFTRRQTPVSKIMEFIGLGSFFASMAIWPKIALDIPARLIHGFSPFMMYEDSQGRKKRFFTDNQYLPFDMLSHQDINRIGNRLGVPKNQVNYREAVQEKMRQIALQNNTMWMLTAGFATPIMSALICNFAEPYVEKAHNNYLNNKLKLNKTFEKFSDVSQKYKTNEITNSINQIIAAYDNKPINKDLITKIANAMTGDLGPNVALGIEKDLNELINSSNVKIQNTQINEIFTRIESILMTDAKNIATAETLGKITPTEEQLRKFLTENSYLNKPLTKLDIQAIIAEISKQLNINIAEYNKAADKKITPPQQRRLAGFIHKASQNENSHTLENILTKRPANLFDEKAQETVRNLARIFTDINAEHASIYEFTYNELAHAPNTIKANYWNSTIKSIIKTLNITNKEIAQMHYDRKLVGELINQKFWQFATSDTETYKNFIKKLAHDISKIESIESSTNRNSGLIKQMKSTYATAAETLKNAGFKHTADKIFRTETNEVGTLYGATKTFVRNNLLNLTATFSSLINKANIYRTLYKDPEMEFIGAKDLPKEVKEEIVGLIEYLTTEGRVSDYTVKFDFLRNLTPNPKRGALDIRKNTGIKYTHFNPEKLASEGVMIKTDIEFYKKVLKALFESSINPEMAASLSEYSLISNMLKKYRSDMLNEVSNIENFMYPNHKLGNSYTKVTAKERTNMVGAPIDEAFTNTIKQLYNTNKWLKLFGGIGAGLLAFTIVSQFMFGRGKSSRNTTTKRA